MPIGPLTDHSLSRGQPYEVGDGLPFGSDALATEPFSDLGSNQWTLLSQHASDETYSFCRLIRGHSFLFEAAMCVGDSALDDQRLQPAIVLGGYEMQRPAHGPREHDRPVDEPGSIHMLSSEPFGASPKREPSRRQNLGLDASQMSNQINNGSPARPMKMLGGRTQAPNVVVGGPLNP
jgi:hypothetical protein